MDFSNYIEEKTEIEEIIVCPYCKGLGHTIEEKRVTFYETDYIKHQCYLCKGKRVVNKKVTTEYLVIE